MQHELSQFQRARQFLQQLQAVAGGGRHRAFEKAVAVAAGMFGMGHCRIGMRQQLVLATGVFRVQRNANAAAQAQLVVGNQERYRQRLHQMRGQRSGIFRVCDVGHQHEFVCAQPRQAAMRAPVCVQTLGHHHQQAVAQRMTITVVDHLEAVQVDQHDREALPLALGAFDVLHEMLVQQDAVRQPGEWVVQRRQCQFGIGLGQRLRQHIGALLKAARQQRNDQRQHQQDQGHQHHHRRQPRQR